MPAAGYRGQLSPASQIAASVPGYDIRYLVDISGVGCSIGDAYLNYEVDRHKPSFVMYARAGVDLKAVKRRLNSPAIIEGERGVGKAIWPGNQEVGSRE